MSTKLLHFPRWAEVLENSNMPEDVKKSREITLRWYLGWCRKKGIGCSVDSAHAFISWAQREKNAAAWMVEQWKVAIRWYFLEGKKQSAPAMNQSVSEKVISKQRLTSELRYDSSQNSEERMVAFSADEVRILLWYLWHVKFLRLKLVRLETSAGRRIENVFQW